MKNLQWLNGLASSSAHAQQALMLRRTGDIMMYSACAGQHLSCQLHPALAGQRQTSAALNIQQMAVRSVQGLAAVPCTLRTMLAMLRRPAQVQGAPLQETEGIMLIYRHDARRARLAVLHLGTACGRSSAPCCWVCSPSCCCCCCCMAGIWLPGDAGEPAAERSACTAAAPASCDPLPDQRRLPLLLRARAAALRR